MYQKEDLILGALEVRNNYLIDYLNSYIELSKQQSPELALHQHIDAVFEAVHQWVISDNFYGCNFINASAEYHNINDPIYLYAAKYKQATENIITELPKDQTETLGKKIMILLEGATVTTQVRGDKKAIHTARITLNTLLKQYFETTLKK